VAFAAEVEAELSAEEGECGDLAYSGDANKSLANFFWRWVKQSG
jgi:hypothetical protein|tara:strand:- start:1929 stop:2060 length:132 start_codon:yes stop_codon:yes gene_type:complete